MDIVINNQTCNRFDTYKLIGYIVARFACIPRTLFTGMHGLQLMPILIATDSGNRVRLLNSWSSFSTLAVLSSSITALRNVCPQDIDVREALQPLFLQDQGSKKPGFFLKSPANGRFYWLFGFFYLSPSV
jgi:hypothetical protein